MNNYDYYNVLFCITSACRWQKGAIESYFRCTCAYFPSDDICSKSRKKVFCRLRSPDPEEQSPAPDYPYFCIAVTRQDKIKGILGDERSWSILQTVIHRYIGFRRVKTKNSIISITVCGFPFREGQGTQDSVLMKMMSVDLMQTLYTAGWILVFGSNMSRRDGVVSWFFRRRTLSLSYSTERSATNLQITPGSEACSNFAENFLVIGLSSTNAFQIINAPPAISDGLIETTKRWYRFGVPKLRPVLNNNIVVKLKGNPWMSHGVDKLAGQLLMLNLMSYLEGMGYAYYGCGDLKGTTDTLFFRLANGESDSGSSETSKQYHYFMVSLEDQDRLVLVNPTKTLIACVRKCLQQHWPHGMKDEGQKLCSYEFCMHGHPWWSEGKDAVTARKVLAYIFDELSSLGYNVMSTLDMSRKVSDKSTFVLKALPHSPPEKITPLKHICISMSSEDKMRLIHFTSKQLLMTVRNTVITNWPNGLIEEGKSYESYELRLDGCPWGGSQSSTDSTLARVMMTRLLDVLERLGWQMITSADVSAKYHSFESKTFPLDVDSWYLAKPMSIVLKEKDGKGGSPASNLSNASSSSNNNENS